MAEPWDKMVQELTKCKTLKEVTITKSNYYSRHYGSPLTRELDFGVEHTIMEFDFVYGNYSQDFKIYILTQNDTIILAQIQRVNRKGKILEAKEFSTDKSKFTEFLEHHNEFYLSSFDSEEFIRLTTSDYYYSFGCGETGSNRPPEADKIMKWVQSTNIKRIKKWLVSPNFELQAYALEGLYKLQNKGHSLTAETIVIMEHLDIRNSIVINCSGCLMGLETPMNELIIVDN